MHNQHKIVSQADQAQELAEKYRQEKKTIVLTQGSFDMLHIGHARYCTEAKKYGDVLFVGVDSDEKIRKRKGPDRPVVPQDERMEMLTYLSSVDHVILKPLNVPKWNLIEKIRPDKLITTQETYTPEQIAALEKICGEVVVLEPLATTSTSAKIRLLQVGAAKKIGATMTTKLIKSIEEVLEELKAGS
jgi:D-beta-D-heptose 7-phosphate kinase/D-beta-D-heptose 1-phosphate adenosyltransferase